MARLSKTGGKARARKASPAKGRKTTKTAKAKTKRRIVLKSGPRKPRSVSDPMAQLDLRTKQLDEALAQQTATGEILKVINDSAGNLAPVFDIILEKAHSLCGVTSGSLELYEGDIARSVAARGMNERWEKYLRQGYRITEVLRPAYQSLRPGHVDDMRKIVERFPDEPTYRAFVEIGHLRTFLALPLVKDDIVIGRIVAARAEVEPFTDGQIKLLQSFADHAVIAIENARLLKEQRELLQQQTATAEILKVINSSPGDLAPVFDIILEKAHSLCDVTIGSLEIHEGKFARTVAMRGFNEQWGQWLGRGYRLIREELSDLEARGHVHIVDMRKIVERFPNYTSARAFVEIGGLRTFLGLTLAKDGKAFGRIIAARDEVRPFTDKQIALLQSFADQAVIAIENARLLTEQREALERQTAAAEVLQVISSSVSDTAPVFEKIISSCEQLFSNSHAAIALIGEDGLMHLQQESKLFDGASSTGELVKTIQAQFPRPVRDSIHGYAIHKRQVLNYGDVQNGEDVPKGLCQTAKDVSDNYSIMIAPMFWEDEGIGALQVVRVPPVPFTKKDTNLLKTFADQAVIAIQNARLFNETKEALEQQTATADILSVISSSVADTTPVFEQILDSCERLAAFDRMAIFLLGEDGQVHIGAYRGGGNADALKATFPQPLANTPMSLAFERQQALFFGDVLNNQDAPASLRIAASSMGSFSVLVAPLLWEGRGIGAFHVARDADATFTDKEVALFKTFADQAVIAIQNARLFNETREALEQQKASADILSVISNSVADAQPVFDKILVSCKQLFGGDELDVLLVDGQGQLNIAAYIGDFHDVIAATFPAPVERTPAGRAIRERRVMHWPDLVDGEDVPGVLRKMAKLIGYRSMVFAPLLWEGRGIGAIGVARSTGPFKPKELAMIQTFADQAVIAIENARLFNETKEALERQTATAEILKVIASSPSDLQPVFEAIAERSNRLVDALSTTVFTLADGMMHLRAFTPTTPEADATLQVTFPAPLSTFSWGESIRRGEIYRIIDSDHEPEGLRDLARFRGWRSCLCVPLLREGKPIGMIGPTRAEPGPFTDHHVQLLQTFADQAVIAISNVGLFNEVQERTRELSASLDDLRAAQDRLVQTEKLASLGQLTAGIAHEIKNPLNFVNNFSALSAELIDELDETLAPAPLDQKMRGEVGELTQMLKSNLEKVVQHGKRADSIVKNMLLHSREGSGEQRPADINALLDESLNLAYHGARAEKPGFNITLQRDFDASAGAIEVFPQEITRAFLNLISNGFYAATRRKMENGDPDFEPVLSAATKNLDNHVEIRIRDNGTGIPPEVKEKIFNPFFTTKPAGEGTGLGLSMSHDIIVKQHGGRIEVETEPGQFHRIQDRPAACRGIAYQVRRTFVNLLILVVDDEPDVEALFRQQFRRELRAGRFAMEFAQSAPMALERIINAGNESLILILSDINMPGMSGLELLPKAKAIRPNVPIIMITAYGDEETKRQALENGAAALLTKPIDFGTLRSEIGSRVESAA